MKLIRTSLITLVIFSILVSTSMAVELTTESLEGDWIFTHIIMDGEREIKLNYKTEFLADGTAVYYDAAGNQSTRGTYVVEGDTIIYTDEKGEQKWKLVSMDENSLHVDHRGAEMFFKRP